MTELKITNTLSKGLKVFNSKSKKVSKIGMKKMGVQLLNNVVNGSPRQSVVPPIDSGLLRGSGSVFLQSELVKTAPKFNGQGAPNKSFSGKENEVTVGFDTSYAAKMHERSWSAGRKSAQSGDVGNKFIEKHLRDDGNELFRLYGKILQRELFAGGL